MKAITTTYHGPGNVRGSRIIADDSDGNRVTVGVDNSLRTEDCHAAAALALCHKMKWQGKLQGGHVKVGMVWAWINPVDQIVAK